VARIQALEDELAETRRAQTRAVAQLIELPRRREDTA